MSVSVENRRIAIIGAGNVTASLAPALVAAGFIVVAVWSRSEESARLLSERIGSPYFTDIDSLPDADIVIISVTDNALSVVARAVANRYNEALVLHTAGSLPMALLREAGCCRYGVFYPMQTFSKSRLVDFSTVSLFVEGCCEESVAATEDIARSIGARVYRATSEQRRFLHLAAVFVCNFPNALYAMAAELLERNGLPFEAMLPLIDETAAKVHQLSPREAQTGPARRGDTVVMQRQRELLNGELLDTYNLLSEYIQNTKYDKL